VSDRCEDSTGSPEEAGNSETGVIVNNSIDENFDAPKTNEDILENIPLVYDSRAAVYVSWGVEAVVSRLGRTDVARTNVERVFPAGSCVLNSPKIDDNCDSLAGKGVCPKTNDSLEIAGGMLVGAGNSVLRSFKIEDNAEFLVATGTVLWSKTDDNREKAEGILEASPGMAPKSFDVDCVAGVSVTKP
jgi:hypothetical protein